MTLILCCPSCGHETTVTRPSKLHRNKCKGCGTVAEYNLEGLTP